MTTLKQPSPENQKLAAEWIRQYAAGEIYAKYWQWSYIDAKNKLEGTINPEITPNFYEGCVFSYAPAPAHPHYAIYKEWEAHKSTGAVDRGEYCLYFSCGFMVVDIVGSPDWTTSGRYTIQKKDKHPDNRKPKLMLSCKLQK
jgi:hypothetical protein